MKDISPNVIGPEGNLQLSQDLGGFLHASLKLTTHRHSLLAYLATSRATMKNGFILPSLIKIFIVLLQGLAQPVVQFGLINF